MNAVGVHPFVSGKMLDPEFRRWGFAAYCNDQYRNELANLPRLFRDEFDAMFANIA
jgi:hypothetical protein